MTPVGGVELLGVWLDDRRRCRWALRDVHLSLAPGEVIVLEADDEEDEGAAEALFDLLCGRRRPVSGVVGGVCPDAVETGSLIGHGERRLCLPGGLEIVVRASSATRQAASRTIRLTAPAFGQREAEIPA